MRILVVEDEEISALVLVDNLKRLGHNVELATDGERGWELIQSANYPLVILDWMLPKLTGIELCRRIRSHPHAASSYVILLTGKTDEEDRRRAIQTGADDFLTKPVNVADLKARVSNATDTLR